MLVFLAIAVIGSLLLMLHRYLGVSIDEQGFLQEPFALLPIGYFLLVVGFFGAAMSLFIGRRK